MKSQLNLKQALKISIGIVILLALYLAIILAGVMLTGFLLME